MASRAEKYLAHLDRLSGGAKPTFLHVDSTKPDLKGVTVAAYQNLPNDLTTALTYGVSLADHPDWRHGRPELCLSVRSADDSWPWALGRLGEGMRGECPFSYADVIDFGEPISPESRMSAFVVFAPAVLDPEDARVEVGSDKVTRDQVTRDQVTRDQVTRDEWARDQVTRDERARDQVTRDEMTHDQLAYDPVTQDEVIHIVGLYPIHEAERQFIASRGLEAFWAMEWDPYDVRRPPAV